MILAVACALLLLFAIPLAQLWAGGQLRRDVFSPAAFVPLLTIVTTIPYLVGVGLDRELIDPLLRERWRDPDLPGLFAYYGLVQGVGFVAVMAGIHSGIGTRLAALPPVWSQRLTLRRARVGWAVGLVAGFGALAIYVVRSGGVLALLLNLNLRTMYAAGAGYLLAIVGLAQFAFLLNVYSLGIRRGPGRFVVAAGTLVFVGAAYLLLGARLPVVLTIVMAVIMWHYGVAPVRRVQPGVLVPVLGVVALMVLVPILRAPGALQQLSEGRALDLGADILSGLQKAYTQLTYVYTYVLITGHFDLHNAYGGATYADLLAAAIPSTLVRGKPPVDEGVYVFNVALGAAVRPGTPFSQLFPNSWPAETLGAMYMNFLLPGVVIGMFVLGVVYDTTYRYMLRSGRSFATVYLYGLALTTFHLSNIRLVNFSTNAALMFVYATLLLRARPLRSTAPA